MFTRIFTVLCLVMCLGGSLVLAQPPKVKPSQKGTVSQTVANTEILIIYYRPVARGRTLFGPKGIIKFDKMWMPGANEATNIIFTDDVLIHGKSLKAGRYSIWSIPSESKWTIIGKYYVGPANEVKSIAFG